MWSTCITAPRSGEAPQHKHVQHKKYFCDGHAFLRRMRYDADMKRNLPCTKEFAQRLAELSDSQRRVIADASGVGLSTIRRIAQGISTNPGLETVRAINAQLLRIEVKNENL
jgi:transcriptional regulator with XRE-family HTH domain